MLLCLVLVVISLMTLVLIAACDLGYGWSGLLIGLFVLVSRRCTA